MLSRRGRAVFCLFAELQSPAPSSSSRVKQGSWDGPVSGSLLKYQQHQSTKYWWLLLFLWFVKSDNYLIFVSSSPVHELASATPTEHGLITYCPWHENIPCGWPQRQWWQPWEGCLRRGCAGQLAEPSDDSILLG